MSFYIAYVEHKQEEIGTVVVEHPFNGNGNSFDRPGTPIKKFYTTRAGAERQARKRWYPAAFEAGYIQVIEI